MNIFFQADLSFHSVNIVFGRADILNFDEIIFISDYIEEGRTYDGVDILREHYQKDFNKCFIECLKEETLHLKNKKAEIYRLTLQAHEYYVKGENI